MGRRLHPLLGPARTRAVSRHAAAALCLCGVLSASAIARPSDSVPEVVEDAVVETDPSFEDVSFEDAFAPITDSAKDGIDLRLPGAHVDLDSFDPPIERPVPAEQLGGGRVIRTLGTGVASYYGRRFHGRRTANGERFDMHAMTAAHKTLPFGSRVRVTHAGSGRSVTVRINDRGPFIRGRTIDLSRAAAERIGLIATGHARVELALVSD